MRFFAAVLVRFSARIHGAIPCNGGPLVFCRGFKSQEWTGSFIADRAAENSHECMRVAKHYRRGIGCGFDAGTASIESIKTLMCT